MSRTKSVPGAPSMRLLRVGESVRHAISSVLARGDIQDPELEKTSVTVSEVRVSPDLRHAKVYVMPLGGDKDGKIVKALNRHTAFIRGQMGKALTMKYTPQLRFKLDESFDEATHIDAILRDPRVARDIDHSDTEEDDQ